MVMMMTQIINDDLTIPDFLRRKPGEKRQASANAHPIIIEEDKPTSMFVRVVPPPKKKAARKGPREVVNVQERIRQKASWHIAEIEGMIDDKAITPEWSLYDHARKQEWSAPVAKKISEHYVPIANELLEVMSVDDADLKYAYRGYSEDDILNMGVMYQGFVDEASRWADTAKKLKPRKKKLPSMERVLKHFVYAKTDETYKLASIDPSKIIGAMELWVFHPKSKVVTVYKALDRGGLGIKRTTITNVDEKASMSKRMGRKTEERLETVLNGGKVALRKLMEGLNGDSLKLTRITKNHLLLRAE